MTSGPSKPAARGGRRSRESRRRPARRRRTGRRASRSLACAMATWPAAGLDGRGDDGARLGGGRRARRGWRGRARREAAREPSSPISRRASAARGHDVRLLGLDAEIDAVALGEVQRLARSPPPCRARPRDRRCPGDGRHWSSGSRVPVQSVTSGMPSAAAASITTREPAQRRRRGPPGRDAPCCRCPRAPRASTRVASAAARMRATRRGRHRLRHRRQAGAGEVELGASHSRRRGPRRARPRARCPGRSWRRSRAASDRPGDGGELHPRAGLAPSGRSRPSPGSRRGRRRRPRRASARRRARRRRGPRAGGGRSGRRRRAACASSRRARGRSRPRSTRKYQGLKVLARTEPFSP